VRSVRCESQFGHHGNRLYRALQMIWLVTTWERRRLERKSFTDIECALA
jgi:hypothetical protein